VPPFGHLREWCKGESFYLKVRKALRVLTIVPLHHILAPCRNSILPFRMMKSDGRNRELRLASLPALTLISANSHGATGLKRKKQLGCRMPSTKALLRAWIRTKYLGQNG
jgi:hypothetical protein